jgi:hypothetical protein
LTVGAAGHVAIAEAVLDSAVLDRIRHARLIA